MRSTPKSLSGDYVYFSGQAARSLPSSYNEAVLAAFEKAAMFAKVTVSSEIKSTVTKNGIEAIRTTSIVSDKISFKNCFLADDYRDDQNQYVLIGVPKKEATLVPQHIEASWGKSPLLWGIVPSLAQFKCGQNLKGALFLSGELLLAGSAVVAHNFISSNESKRIGTSGSTFKFYDDKVRTNTNIRNIAAIGAIAFWIYNYMDGAVADKPKRYAVENKNRLEVFPYIADKSYNLGLNYRF